MYRYAINLDGFCFFDSLVFLYLYYYRDDTIVNKDVVKNDWVPDDQRCKGNLMKFVFYNQTTLYQNATDDAKA